MSRLTHCRRPQKFGAFEKTKKQSTMLFWRRTKTRPWPYKRGENNNPVLLNTICHEAKSEICFTPNSAVSHHSAHEHRAKCPKRAEVKLFTSQWSSVGVYYVLGLSTTAGFTNHTRVALLKSTKMFLVLVQFFGQLLQRTCTANCVTDLFTSDLCCGDCGCIICYHIMQQVSVSFKQILRGLFV